MSDALLPLADASDSFLVRVVRWVAVICVAKGLLGIGSAISEFLYARYYYSPAIAPLSMRLEHGMRVFSAVVMVLLAIAGLGLLRSRPWSRPLLMVWAVLTVVMSIASTCVSLARIAEIQQRTRPTTFPAGMASAYQPMPTGYLTMMSLLSAIGYWAFPILILAIVMQPEVRELLMRRHIGSKAVQSPAPPSDGGEGQ